MRTGVSVLQWGVSACLSKRLTFLSGVFSGLPVVHIAVWLNPYSIITHLLSLSVLCGEAFWLGFIIRALCPFAASCEFDSGAILESAGSTDEVWGATPGEAGPCSFTDIA